MLKIDVESGDTVVVVGDATTDKEVNTSTVVVIKKQ